MKSLLLVAALLVACSDPPNTQYLPIGSRCANDAQCGTPKYACAVTGYPGGYCEKPCAKDVECPADSHCSPTHGQCRRACKSTSECRASAGYACIATTAGYVCDVDGAPPSG